jgi:5-methylcytosine-specific restriction endonuclease McrA
MDTNNFSFAHLSDDQLLVRVKELVRQDRVTTARLLVHLAEMEERRLHCREGCASLFTYCVEVLHLSEPAAYRRVKAARLARRFPGVLNLLTEGSIHLAALDILAAHLTEANHVTLLAEARHKTKREVEELVARLRPLPDVPPMVRMLPGPDFLAQSAVSAPAAVTVMAETTSMATSEPELAPEADPKHRSAVAPLSPSRYKIQFTAGAETYRKLQQVQELMRHRVPDGDPAAIVDTALTVLLEKLLKEKTGATARPRRRKSAGSESGKGERQQPTPGTGEARRRRVAAGKPTESRHIPAAVKRAVWRRDGGRCAFTAGNGRRCSSRGPLEYHHVEPYVLGGKATIGNIALRCRAHNEYEGELQFGRRRARVPGNHAPNTPKTLPGESSGGLRSQRDHKLSPERVLPRWRSPERVSRQVQPG